MIAVHQVRRSQGQQHRTNRSSYTPGTSGFTLGGSIAVASASATDPIVLSTGVDSTNGGPKTSAGTLYACGTQPGNGNKPSLYALSFQSPTGVMNSTPAMSDNRNINGCLEPERKLLSAA